MKKSTGSVLQEKACCFEQFQSSDMDNLIKIFVDTLGNVWHFHYNLFNSKCRRFWYMYVHFDNICFLKVQQNAYLKT